MANVINGTSTGSGGLIQTGDDSGVLNIQTNETTAITVDASQNVGIGTTSPDALLTVNTIASFGAGAAATPSIAAKGDLNTGVFFPAADTLAASTGGSERMRINSSGNVKFVGSISVGDATPTTSGAGITFPATQSASSNANTLDDYEEGTFTPTYFGSSSAGTTTYNSRSGFYTKVGNLVSFTIYVAPASATGTGSIQIGSLPFTSSSATQGDTLTLMVNAQDWNTGSYLVGFLSANSTTILPYGVSDNAGWGEIAITNASTTWIISGCYRLL